jgi:hypothetical protein
MVSFHFSVCNMQRQHFPTSGLAASRPAHGAGRGLVNIISTSLPSKNVKDACSRL